MTFEPVAGWVLLRYPLVWRSCCRDTRWRCFAAGRQTWSSLQWSILHKFWRARETIREWRNTAPNLHGEEWPLKPRQIRSTRTRKRRKKTQLVSGLTLFCVCLWLQLKDLNEMPFCRWFKLLSFIVSTSQRKGGNYVMSTDWNFPGFQKCYTDAKCWPKSQANIHVNRKQTALLTKSRSHDTKYHSITHTIHNAYKNAEDNMCTM